MKIVLTNQEAETMFHNALCNGLDYISGYGLELKAKDDEYEAAKQRLKEQTPNNTVCYEDILLEVLKGGGSLEMIDYEMDSYNAVIRIEDVYNRLPETQGFFFGTNPPDEYSREQDMAFISKAKISIANGAAVYYDSWW
jgi:hypothetical protein